MSQPEKLLNPFYSGTKSYDDILERKFNCKFSEETFKTKLQLNYHKANQHPKDKPSTNCDSGSLSLLLHDNDARRASRTLFKCEICNKTYSTFVSLSEHNILLHHSEVIKESHNKCEICFKIFQEPRNLKMHLKAHSSVKRYACNYCNKSYTSSGSRKLHEMVHTGEKPFDCKFCERKFTRNVVLVEHMQGIHLNEKNYGCRYGDKYFVSQGEANRHEKKFHIGKTQTLLSDLNNPGKGHTNDTPSKPEDVVLNQRHLNNHQQKKIQYTRVNDNRIQTNENPYKCNYCKKSFTILTEKYKHEKVHTAKKILNCKFCKEVFLFKSHLNNHIRRIHLKEKIHGCQYCKKSFVTYPEAKIHERIHTGEKPFACNFCPKKFSQIGNLHTHVKRDHTKEKSHGCQFCGKRFVNTHEQKNHVQRKHTSEKSYGCRLCLKRFVTERELKIHERRHTGERPFKCDVCDKTFTSSSAKWQHQEKSRHYAIGISEG